MIGKNAMPEQEEGCKLRARTDGGVAGCDRAEEVVRDKLGLLGADGGGVIGPVLGHGPGGDGAVGQGEICRWHRHAASHRQCHTVGVRAHTNPGACTQE